MLVCSYTDEHVRSAWQQCSLSSKDNREPDYNVKTKTLTGYESLGLPMSGCCTADSPIPQVHGVTPRNRGQGESLQDVKHPQGSKEAWGSPTVANYLLTRWARIEPPSIDDSNGGRNIACRVRQPASAGLTFSQFKWKLELLARKQKIRE